LAIPEIGIVSMTSQTLRAHILHTEDVMNGKTMNDSRGTDNASVELRPPTYTRTCVRSCRATIDLYRSAYKAMKDKASPRKKHVFSIAHGPLQGIKAIAT
ncbi:hypothetical protein BGX34_004039, partial [Mortierella sp. NVP85]